MSQTTSFTHEFQTQIELDAIRHLIYLEEGKIPTKSEIIRKAIAELLHSMSKPQSV